MSKNNENLKNQVVKSHLATAISIALFAVSSPASAQEPTVPTLFEEVTEQNFEVQAKLAPGACAVNIPAPTINLGQIIPDPVNVTEHTESLEFTVECQTQRRVALQIKEVTVGTQEPPSYNANTNAFKFDDVEKSSGESVAVGFISFKPNSNVTELRNFGVAYIDDNGATVEDNPAPMKFANWASAEDVTVFIPTDLTESDLFDRSGILAPYGPGGGLGLLTNLSGSIDVIASIRPMAELDLGSNSPVDLSATYALELHYL